MSHGAGTGVTLAGAMNHCPACAHVLFTATPLGDTLRLPSAGELAMCVQCFALLIFEPPLLRALPRDEAKRLITAARFSTMFSGALQRAVERATPGDYLVWRWPWEDCDAGWILLAALRPGAAIALVGGNPLMPTVTMVRASGLPGVREQLDAHAALSSAALCNLLDRGDLPDPIPKGSARPLAPGDLIVDLAEPAEYLFRMASCYERQELGGVLRPFRSSFDREPN